MAVTLNEFVTKWGFQVDDGELKKLDAKFAETRKGMMKLADNLKSAGQKMSLFATLPITAFAGFSVKAAADAQDFETRFRRVFTSISDEGVKSITEFGLSIGLAGSEIQKVLGGLGQYLQNMGFSEEASLSYAKSIASLSADIAEFNSVEGGSETVQEAITAALAGRTMGLKQIGVAIDKDMVKNEVAAQALRGLTYRTEKQAEAAAIMALIQKQTQNAVGAFTGSTEDLDVQMAILNARVKTLRESFGKILLPIAINLAKAMGDLVKWFDSFSTGSKTLILVVGGIVAAIGPLLILTGSIINAVMAWKTALTVLGNTALASWVKVFLPVLGFAAILAAGFLIFDDIKGYFEGKDSVTGVIFEAVNNLLNLFRESFPKMGGFFLSFLNVVLTPLRMFLSAVSAVGGIIGTIMGGGGFSDIMDVLKQAGGDIIAPFKNQLEGKEFNIAESIGFGARERLPQTTAAQTTTQSTNTNAPVSVNSPITVNVPQGTPPEKVGPAVQRGVSDGLQSLLRETQRSNRTAVVN